MLFLAVVLKLPGPCLNSEVQITLALALILLHGGSRRILLVVYLLPANFHTVSHSKIIFWAVTVSGSAQENNSHVPGTGKHSVL